MEPQNVDFNDTQTVQEAFQLVEEDINGIDDQLNVMKGVVLAVVLGQALHVILHLRGRRANANAE